MSNINPKILEKVFKFVPKDEHDKIAPVSKDFLVASNTVYQNPFISLKDPNEKVLNFSGIKLNKIIDEVTGFQHVLNILLSNKERSLVIEQIDFSNCCLQSDTLPQLSELVSQGYFQNVKNLNLAFNSFHDSSQNYDDFFKVVQKARNEGFFLGEILTAERNGELCLLEFANGLGESPVCVGDIIAYRDGMYDEFFYGTKLKGLIEVFGAEVTGIDEDKYHSYETIKVFARVLNESDDYLKINPETGKASVFYGSGSPDSDKGLKQECNVLLFRNLPLVLQQDYLEFHLSEEEMGQVDEHKFVTYELNFRDTFENDLTHHDLLYEAPILDCPHVVNIMDKYQNQAVYEGVEYSDTRLKEDLRSTLMEEIDKFVKSKDFKDYHPGTKDVVHDIIHPGLYSYIEGITKLKSGFQKPDSPQNRDFFDRPYEDSKFQWLPSTFHIDKNSNCKITSYINNLGPRTPENERLYLALENLFSEFLPMLRNVVQYVSNINIATEDSYFDDERYDDKDNLSQSARNLSNRDYQVITKIVDYELNSNKHFDGVWHVEGMSHENIIATGLCILERDENVEGGDIFFKRGVQEHEGAEMVMSFPQSMAEKIREVCTAGITPLGKIETKHNRMIVFPNSHIHKVAELFNKSDDKGIRRIVVFFLVNPDVKIISTENVDPQQPNITLEDAKAFRLELMQERKYYKQSLNVREVELCEH